MIFGLSTIVSLVGFKLKREYFISAGNIYQCKPENTKITK